MSKGFTLIEYIVVISMIGIAAATVVISLSQYAPSLKTSGAARSLGSELRQAQEEAITTQHRHAIRFNTLSSPITYDLIKFAADDSETVVRSFTFPENLTLTLALTITDNQIIFSPDGGPSSSGDITLSISPVTKIVNVSPAGLIKIP